MAAAWLQTLFIGWLALRAATIGRQCHVTEKSEQESVVLEEANMGVQGTKALHLLPAPDLPTPTYLPPRLVAYLLPAPLPPDPPPTSSPLPTPCPLPPSGFPGFRGLVMWHLADLPRAKVICSELRRRSVPGSTNRKESDSEDEKWHLFVVVSVFFVKYFRCFSAHLISVCCWYLRKDGHFTKVTASTKKGTFSLVCVNVVVYLCLSLCFVLFHFRFKCGCHCVSFVMSYTFLAGRPSHRLRHTRCLVQV